MAVQAIRLSNFLAFEETDWLELCPIVFIYGHNSSGKSAIGHAFKVMRETFGINNPTDQFSLQGMKGISTILHKDSTDQKNNILTFHFRCSPSFGLGPKINDFSMYRGLNVDEKTQLVISLSFQRIEGSDDIGKLTSTSIDLPKKKIVNNGIGDIEVENILSIQLNSIDAQDNPCQWKFSSQILDINLAHTLLEQITLEENQSLPRIKSSNGSLFDLTRIEMTQEEAEDEGFDPYKNTNDPRNVVRYIDNLLQALTNDISRFVESVKYISPLKLESLSMLVQKAQKNQEKIPENLASWLERSEISQALKTDLLNALKIAASSHQKQKIDLAGFEHTGTGFTFFLSYMLLLISFESDSLILLEHPDAFLDPINQMELMDFLIITALGANNTLVIETHSEYILLRAMKRIRQSSKKRLPYQFRNMNHEIEPGKFNIIVSQKTSNTNSITVSVTINKLGEIEKWPGEFFEEGFIERFYDNAF
ncbi:MAG: AAA family ATPase [Chloroflexi bacterium]|nr:AAA family ATPase [Chloroflexota bacterium]